MKISFFTTFILITLFLSAALITYLLYPSAVPLNPLNYATSNNPSLSNSKSYTLLGFLPYWNLKKLTPQAATSLTDLAYFTLRLNGAGELVTHNNPREEESGYTNFKRLQKAGNLCKQAGLNDISCPALTLTYAQLDEDALTSLLSSAASRHRAVQTIMDNVQQTGAVGVNIDFEPLGSTSPSLRQNFTDFIALLHSKTSVSNINISVSVYPSAASRARLWDLENLAPLIDQLVVMTYDYTLPNSPKTGPNSPLRGAGHLFEHDIMTNLAEISAVFPKEKILLGIPFYGYEWSTDSSDKYTTPNGRAVVASLERIQQMLDDKTLELLWDRNSFTPYAVKRVAGEVVSQVYFEDLNSLTLKLELVKEAGLGGIAIWAIGYEGNYAKLWPTISGSLPRQ